MVCCETLYIDWVDIGWGGGYIDCGWGYGARWLLAWSVVLREEGIACVVALRFSRGRGNRKKAVYGPHLANFEVLILCKFHTNRRLLAGIGEPRRLDTRWKKEEL
jgi:hypothetical protein